MQRWATALKFVIPPAPACRGSEAEGPAVRPSPSQLRMDSSPNLKPRRPLLRHMEAPLHRQTSAPQPALIEQPADQGDAMRNPPRRRKLSRRLGRIWSPVTPLFRDLNEPGPQSERRMASSIGDSKHLVPQGRNQKQIHLGKHAAHLVGHLSPEAIRLHEINRGKKACLAKRIGPRIRHLHLELIDTVRERQLLEGGSRFGEQD